MWNNKNLHKIKKENISENLLIFAVQFRSDKTYLGKCNLIIITINKS